MGGVFLCYRHDDSSGYAVWIFEHLQRRFRRHAIFRFRRHVIFRDVDGLRPGVDFSDYIKTTIANSDVLIALIGQRWIPDQDRGRKRLEDPEDFVRLEIVTALQQGLEIIPTLVDDSSMPAAEELPEELRPITRFHAIDIHNRGARDDLKALMDAVDLSIRHASEQKSLRARRSRQEQKQKEKESRKRLAGDKRSKTVVAREKDVRRLEERLTRVVAAFLAAAKHSYPVRRWRVSVAVLVVIGICAGLVYEPPALLIFSAHYAASLADAAARFSSNDDLRMRYLSRSIDLDSSDWNYTSFLERGRIYFKRKQWSQALRDFQDCDRRVHDPTYVSIDLSKVYRQLGHPETALKYVNAYINWYEQKPESQRYWIEDGYEERARVLDQLGDREAAARDRKKTERVFIIRPGSQ